MGPKKRSAAEAFGSAVPDAPVQSATAVGHTPITQFRGEYDFLSNFYKSPIHRDGLEYPTVEHAFQAAKCLDQAGKLTILKNKSPAVAKRVGRTVKLRSDWESVKLDIMREILTLKFAAGSELCAKLLQTGDAPLVEGNKWHDNFWGSCVCDKHRATPGLNHLGSIMMGVREQRRAETAA